MTEASIAEKSFREGYLEGYTNGENDQARYEWGGGSAHRNIAKSDQDSAWENGDAKHMILLA